MNPTWVGLKKKEVVDREHEENARIQEKKEAKRKSRELKKKLEIEEEEKRLLKKS